MNNFLNGFDFPKNKFYIFNQLQNFYCHIIEKDLTVMAGGNTGSVQTGLPFDLMKEQVAKIYTLCNATLVQYPNEPPGPERAAMREVLHWVQGADDEYSLQIAFDPKYLNSSFIRCFNESITTWVHDYFQHMNSQVAIAFGVMIAVFFAAVVIFFGTGLFKEKIVSGIKQVSGLFKCGEDNEEEELLSTTSGSSEVVTYH